MNWIKFNDPDPLIKKKELRKKPDPIIWFLHGYLNVGYSELFLHVVSMYVFKILLFVRSQGFFQRKQVSLKNKISCHTLREHMTIQ